MIRLATDADLPDILDIYNDAIAHTTAIFEYRRHTLDMRREWFRAKQAASTPVFAAVDGDRVIGFASYGP
jgi:L-amino acid N-acyltransferase